MTDIVRPSTTEPVLVSTSGRGRLTPLSPTDAPLATLAVVILRHLVLLVLVPFVTVVLTAWLFLSRREYWAQSKFTPLRQESAASGLMGLAANFGVSVPGARASESLEFYADLVKSREILDSVALTVFRFPVGPEERDTMSGNVIELYQVEGRTPHALLQRARNKLSRSITATPRRTSGTVTLRTTAPWPHLAERINRRLLDLVNQFNTSRRMSAGGAERRFLEARLGEARTELEESRQAQRNFLDRNRVWQNDPHLTLQMQQIEAQVAQRTQLAQGLADAYERARQDEVRNTPVITVVDAPEGSRRREGGLVTNLRSSPCKVQPPRLTQALQEAGRTRL